MLNRIQVSFLGDAGYGWFGAVVSAVAVGVVVWSGYQLGQAQERQSWLAASKNFQQKLDEEISYVKSAVAQIDDEMNATPTLKAIHGAYPSLRSAYLINDEDGTALRVYPTREPLTRLPVGIATGGLLSYTQMISTLEEQQLLNRLQTVYTGGKPQSVASPFDSKYLAILWRLPRASSGTRPWRLGVAKFDLNVLLKEVRPSSIDRVSLVPFDGAKELIVEIEKSAHAIYLSPPKDASNIQHFWIAALILSVLLLYTQFALELQRRRGVKLEIDMAKMQQIQHRQTRLANLGEVSSRISHELNQPLFAIEALSTTLLRHPDMVAERRQSALTKIRAEASRAARATNAILNFSRAKAKDARREAIDIKTLVDQLYPLILMEAQRRGVKVSRSIVRDAHGVVDRAAVEIFITTALTNALDAISEASTDDPEVSIKVCKPTDNALSIRISNNGPSIPEETQQSMFKDFYTTKTYGTGLGLSTARALARQAGGEITFQSIEPDGHPEFNLTVPIKAQKLGAEQ